MLPLYNIKIFLIPITFLAIKLTLTHLLLIILINFHDHFFLANLFPYYLNKLFCCNNLKFHSNNNNKFNIYLHNFVLIQKKNFNINK